MQDGKHVILIVDDDSDIRSAMALVLQQQGYVVVEAGSAEEGLRRYKATSPDLVIVDLMMEEVDSGTLLVKELRLVGNSAPVFILSSVGDALNEQLDYTDLGLAGVLQKPVERSSFLATLEARLGA